MGTAVVRDRKHVIDHAAILLLLQQMQSGSTMVAAPAAG